jgi:cullin-associated NEDD8-dissociated protein 1
LVAAAIRYTFIDTSSTYDELIAPVIVDFLSLMQDENLVRRHWGVDRHGVGTQLTPGQVVQRLALTSLNAAIQNKPHLIVDRLDMLQPLLYVQTKIRQDLLRVVQKGPFKGEF